MENCDNRKAMTDLAQNRGLHDTTSILQFRHMLWDCYVNCGWIIEKCKNDVMYCLNKSWSNIEVK